MSQANTTLPAGLEVFKAGRRIDDSGRPWDFTPAQVADMAAVYDPKLREAPLTIGHPANDLPAYGWAEKFTAHEGTLRLDSRDVEPQFAELYAKRRFPKVSMAFYPPDHQNNPAPGRWYPRHVTFLGAQAPAVAGLHDPTRKANFADSGEGLVCFSEGNEKDPMDKQLEEQRDAEKARADKAEAEARAANERLAQISATQRTERHTANVQFAEQMLSKGLLKKPQVAETVAVLDALGNLEQTTVQFGEGDDKKTSSLVTFVKDRIAAAAPLANFSEKLPGGAGEGGGNGGQQLSDEDIDKKAKAYAAEHKVSYSEALGKVVSFTN